MKLNKQETLEHLKQGKEITITKHEAFIRGVGYVNMNSANSLKKELKLKATLIMTHHTHDGKDWITKFKPCGGIFEIA